MIIYKIISLIARYYPFERGRMRCFLELFFRKKGEFILANLKNPILMKAGFKMFTFERDFLSLWYRLYRHYEPETIDFLRRTLRSESVFLDLGSNLGFFSLISQKIQPTCQVIAIEASPITYDLLTQSIAANGFSNNIKAFNKAVCDQNTEIDFFINTTNSGDSCMISTPNEKTTKVTIKGVSLDEDSDFFEALGDKKIDLIKMDIQGAELSALKGMIKLLKKHRPIILLEFDETSMRRFNYTPEDFLSFMKSIDYSVSEKFDLNLVFTPFIDQ